MFWLLYKPCKKFYNCCFKFTIYEISVLNYFYFIVVFTSVSCPHDLQIFFFIQQWTLWNSIKSGIGIQFLLAGNIIPLTHGVVSYWTKNYSKLRIMQTVPVSLTDDYSSKRFFCDLTSSCINPINAAKLNK